MPARPDLRAELSALPRRWSADARAEAARRYRLLLSRGNTDGRIAVLRASAVAIDTRLAARRTRPAAPSSGPSVAAAVLGPGHVLSLALTGATVGGPVRFVPADGAAVEVACAARPDADGVLSLLVTVPEQVVADGTAVHLGDAPVRADRVASRGLAARDGVLTLTGAALGDRVRHTVSAGVRVVEVGWDVADGDALEVGAAAPSGAVPVRFDGTRASATLDLCVLTSVGAHVVQVLPAGGEAREVGLTRANYPRLPLVADLPRVADRPAVRVGYDASGALVVEVGPPDVLRRAAP